MKNLKIKFTEYIKTIIKLILFFNLILLNHLLSANNANSQKKLGTLFTSPSIRYQLDQKRNKGTLQQPAKQSLSNTVREPIQIKMKGLVIRKNKKPVVFINNENTLKSRKINNDITVKTNKIKKQNYNIPVRVVNKTIKLKPGQQWNESNHKIQDNYQVDIITSTHDD